MPQQMQVLAASNRYWQLIFPYYCNSFWIFHNGQPLISSVSVLDRHAACVSLRFATRPPFTVLAVKAVLQSYINEAQTLACYSPPVQAIIVREDIHTAN